MTGSQVAWPKGIKKTKQRKSVFSVLESSPIPLSAIDIFRRIEKEDSFLWLSTVYRILDLFVAEGIVIKTSIIGGNMALYELNRSQHRHYAICVNCRKIVEMNNCPIEGFEPKLADGDFHILGHKVEMYGYCRDCNEMITNSH